MESKVSKLNFERQKIFVGIDVHKLNWKVSIQLENIAQKTFHQSADPEQLQRYLTSHYPGGDYLCAYESGFCGFSVKESLEKLGIPCVVVHAADVPTTHKEKSMKIDKRDSRKIARGLKNGDLTIIYAPSKTAQLDRSLVRSKYMLSKDTRRIKTRIKMQLHYYGIKLPAQYTTGNWSKKMINWIRQNGKERKDRAMEILISELKRLRQLELESLRHIRKLSQSPRYKQRVDLLISVPGIGILTAMTILTELIHIKRFGSLGQVCSYMGMVPSTNSSGEKERIGGLTKRGRGTLRSAIIEASWVAVRRDPALAQQYNKWAKEMRNGQKAIIKIARKLVNRIRRVLITKEPYEIGIL